MSTVHRRHRGLLLRSTRWLLLLLLCAPLAGCMTFTVLEWVDDEVSVDGFRWRRGVGIGDDVPIEAVLRIKNLPGVADDDYLLAPPPDAAERPVISAADGFLEIAPLPRLELRPAGDQVSWVTGASWLVWLGPEDGGVDLQGAADGAVSAFVVPQGEEGFQVHLLRADATRGRWVRVGLVELGPGSQSDARVLAYGALPVSFAWDVYTFPIALVITLGYAFYEENH